MRAWCGVLGDRGSKPLSPPDGSSGEQSLLQNGVQNVHRQHSHTLAVEYATDNHAVLIVKSASMLTSE